MRLGDDYELISNIRNCIDGSEEKETMDNSTCEPLPSDFSMEWHSLEDQTITMGFNNPVQLEDEYYKEFLQGDDFTSELSAVIDEKFICSMSAIQELCTLMSACSECQQPCKVLKSYFSGAVLVLYVVFKDD